ncbi:MAG: DUF998 domain-containing protein [candidate division Zixibacteria bacterium]|nr:DUF998 domain-containing protein [candidate division Zixibacteria bacterium]
MLTGRKIGLIAMITPVWFLTVYLVMSSRRPEYSHLTKAISELGSLDAPNLWVWNILGYILPGLAVALLGIGLKRELSGLGKRSVVPTMALTASGLFMAFSGIFPGDFVNRSSLTMILHTIGSLGSFVIFLIAGFGLPPVFRSWPSWHWVAWPSLVLVIASIVTGFLRTGQAPGLGQRLGFACFFLWIGLVGFALYRANNRTDATSS